MYDKFDQERNQAIIPKSDHEASGVVLVLGGIGVAFYIWMVIVVGFSLGGEEKHQPTSSGFCFLIPFVK